MVAKKRPRVMHFPTLDYLTPYQQEKKLKELASEVQIYNMYDDVNKIPLINELHEMDKDVAKNIVLQAKKKHKQKDLLERWGVTRHTLYSKVYPAFGVLVEGQKDSAETSQEQPATMTIKIQGTFAGEEVQNRLMALAEVLGSDVDFDIDITIKEK